MFYIQKTRGLRNPFFTNETQLILDGYPRSGNTFAVAVVKSVFSKISIVHHYHHIAAFKIAISRGIPALCLIRNPDDAVSSYYLKSFAKKKFSDLPNEVNFDLLTEMLDDYVAFHRFFVSNRNVNLVQFETLTRDPHKFARIVSELIKVPIAENELSQKVEESILKFRGAKDDLGNSLPSEFKEVRKTDIKKELAKLPNYQLANQMYQEIIANINAH